MSKALAVARPPDILPAATACVGAVGALALAAREARTPTHFLLLTASSLLLIALAERDAVTMRLPNRLMYPGLLVALACVAMWPDRSWSATLVGGAVGFCLMLLAYLVLPGFGLGDVKLCALIGLMVGWPHVLPALVIGVLCNGIAALGVLALRRLHTRSIMPYGPGLAIGALVLLLIGSR